ncbi:nitroreductase family deazaflavin-dependent oxidoreductase [Streptomyces sp. NBC_00365]|uniref:nitroreductase/quinone reductase family protein n=1 Tax=Streptomyces sp. NBC_00365 TaxID=2975726 RepID=UPI0022500CC7|nr:nitroreductase/quinone reductase family protein [Streptomyces sp. NBC_00365]MCX5095261.1 nitroreductase family deazaflavin-dependent oxidoreductase [Streptomyces sp. NBC_00365]
MKSPAGTGDVHAAGGNPVLRRLPLQTVLETTDRVSGLPRQTPVGGRRIGDAFWLASAYGERSQYLRDSRANPRVRVRIRGRLHTGTAHSARRSQGHTRTPRILGWSWPGKAFRSLVRCGVGGCRRLKGDERPTADRHRRTGAPVANIGRPFSIWRPGRCQHLRDKGHKYASEMNILLGLGSRWSSGTCGRGHPPPPDVEPGGRGCSTSSSP